MGGQFYCDPLSFAWILIWPTIFTRFTRFNFCTVVHSVLRILSHWSWVAFTKNKRNNLRWGQMISFKRYPSGSLESNDTWSSRDRHPTASRPVTKWEIKDFLQNAEPDLAPPCIGPSLLPHHDVSWDPEFSGYEKQTQADCSRPSPDVVLDGLKPIIFDLAQPTVWPSNQLTAEVSKVDFNNHGLQPNIRHNTGLLYRGELASAYYSAAWTIGKQVFDQFPKIPLR